MGVLNLEQIVTVKNNLHRDLLMAACCQTSETLDALHAKTITNVENMDSVLVFDRRKGQARKYQPGNVKNAAAIGGVWENQAQISVSSVIYHDFIENYRAKEGFSILGTHGEYDPKGIDAVEVAMMAIAEAHGNQNYLNLVHGIASTDDSETSLFDGWDTLITKHIAAGRISAERGNLISNAGLTIPGVSATNDELRAFYRKVVDVYMKTSVLLRQREFDAHCTPDFFVALSLGYAATYTNVNPDIVNQPSFRFPQMPKANWIPNDVWGTGNKLMFTVPNNLELISDIDGNDPSHIISSGIEIWKSDKDHKMLKYQVSTGMATRIAQIRSDKFAVTDGTWTALTNLGGDGYQLTEEETEYEESINE